MADAPEGSPRPHEYKARTARYDFERKAWMRAGAPVLFGEARHSSEAEARAFGEAWRGEGSNERRAYSVLTKDKPFDWSI